jgi:multidrug efflux pump subunit AcrA (membrane-fusion protein)
MITRKKIAVIAAVIILIAVSVLLIWNRVRVPTEEPHRGPIQEAVYGLGTVKSNRIFEHKQGVVS